jgi:protein TonB
LFFSLSIAVGAWGQSTEPTLAAYEEVTQYEVKVDKQASFPGGAKGLMHYIGRHILYPIEAMKKSVQGKVFVKFTVGTDGQIMKTEVIKTDHELLCPAAINTVIGMQG